MSAPIGDRDYAYSSCDHCGTENEPFSSNGDIGTASHNYSTYVCGGAGKGSANDGCGANWSVTTAAGAAHREAVGLETIGRFPRDVSSSRFISMPSEAYMAGWERIWGKKE